MRATVTRWATSSSARRLRFRPSWMTPGLTSHQQLDAGIAARQHAGRKALKKSKRPFDNYFKTQYRISPRVGRPAIQPSGVISSYDAVQMMTNPTRSWAASWDRAAGHVRTRRKRQDVLEPTATQFGEDAIDRVVQRLLEIRFLWDREDGVLCTSLVPQSLFAMSKHCRPYLTEVSSSPLAASSSTAATVSQLGITNNPEEMRGRPFGDGDSHDANEESEVVLVAGTGVRIRRRTPLLRRKSGQPKRPHPHSSLGFSGVDTVPALVLDVSHGPFVTSPSAALLTLRWKGEHREATSAQSALQLLRQVRSVPVVGLTPRSSLLLLKALAAVEVEEPALAISLAIAMGEHYHSYSDTECLELLRCLRRVAFVRELPEMGPPDISTSVLPLSSSFSAVAPALMKEATAGVTVLPNLYTDASLMEESLWHFLSDAAPFLISKVWARLPEQSRRLLRRGYFLDWFDLIGLAIASSGPQRLPERLPNASSEAPYASKYLFFHHTLGLKAAVVQDMVRRLRGSATVQAASKAVTTPAAALFSPTDSGGLTRWENPSSAATGTTTQLVDGSGRGSLSPRFIDDVKEEVERPLILWRCTGSLVRVVAECIGDVVRHVGDSLHHHAAVAAAAQVQPEAATPTAAPDEAKTEDVDAVASAGPLTHGARSPYPRFSSGAYQQMGYRRPKRVRVRLLPFEAFPRVSQCFSCPFASVTEQAEARSQQRSCRAAARSLSHECAGERGGGIVRATSPPEKEVESTFAVVLAASPLMQKHIERASSALEWSAMVLRACRELVQEVVVVDLSPVELLPSSSSPSFPKAERAAGHRCSSDLSSSASREGGEDRWTREAAAREARQMLCYHFVQSTVQRDMDALFTFIPWREMEASWEPMLAPAENDTAGVGGVSSLSDLATDEASLLSAAALGAVLMEDNAAAVAHGSKTATPAALSEAERHARATVKELRERLEDFQVAVADLLEVYERQFPPMCDR